MEKRYEDGAKFILEGDRLVVAVRAWTEKIFHGKETEGFKLPDEIYEWFLEVVFCAYEKAKNDLVRRMILVKIIHTREVVQAGFDITGAEKGYNWNRHLVGMVCLLHDIGRFDQALLGSYSDEKTKFDHALVGSEMISEHKFTSLTSIGIEKAVVVEAVRNHSLYQYEGKDIYAKLTRDADKLALLRSMSEILAAKIGEFEGKGVTEGALAAFRSGKMVRNRDMKTRADLFLAWLGWEVDFNFPATKIYFENEGIRGWMVDELKRLGVEI